MKNSAHHFRALLDAGVPDSVGKVLSAHGHEVIHHREVLPERTTDDEVYETALGVGAILLVVDRDASRAVRRYDAKLNQDRLKTLSVILLACAEPTAHSRLEQAMTLVHLEWAFCRQKTSRRLWIDIGAHYIRTNR